MHLKTYDSVADVPKKVEKTSSENVTFHKMCDSSMILGGFSGIACPGPLGSQLGSMLVAFGGVPPPPGRVSEAPLGSLLGSF